MAPRVSWLCKDSISFSFFEEVAGNRMNHSKHTWLWPGDKSFLMPLWKTKLLKMNQQRLHPRSWEEDEGASYSFPEDLDVVAGVWPPGQQGPRSLT